jgi:hypothetical protein
VADFEQGRALMIRLWRMWGSRAAERSDEQWTTETRLPGWTVRDVYVHITPDVMIEMLAAPPADGEDMAILETTIHWLDVIDAVGGPRPEAMALERTRDILAAVPDPLTFVEATSGRSDSAILPVMH